MTSPVLVVALVALAVGFATFRSTGSEDDAATSAQKSSTPGAGPSWFQGTWVGEAGTAAGGTVAVRLTLRPDSGRLRRAGCHGALRPAGVPGDETAAFLYSERSGKRACPPRTRVVVRPVDGSLRFEETLDGEPYASGTLTRPAG